MIAREMKKLISIKIAQKNWENAGLFKKLIVRLRGERRSIALGQFCYEVAIYEGELYLVDAAEAS